MSSPLVYERNHWIARDWELGDDLNIRREAIASHPGCWFRVREAFTEASNKCSAPNIIDGISDCQGNKHSFTLLNSCFGLRLLRPYPTAQLILSKAGLSFSILSPFIFFANSFFFFGKPIEAAAPHYNCGSCIKGQAKQSSRCRAQICIDSICSNISATRPTFAKNPSRFVMSVSSLVFRWDKIQWSCISNPRALFPDFSGLQVRERSPGNEVVYTIF